MGRDVSVSSLRFLLASNIPELELKNLATQKPINRCRQKKKKKPSSKSLLFLGKGPGKSQPSRTEDFGTKAALLLPNTQKNP